jgi:ribonuclease HI
MEIPQAPNLQDVDAEATSIDSAVQTLVEQIAALSPLQRRQLLLRLRASGLLVPEVLQSDRNRVQAVTSVQNVLQLPLAPPESARTFVRPERGAPAPAAKTPTASANAADYRPPIAGRVVLQANDEAAEPSPHLMLPLPGQAPEQPIRIIFDGGSRGNPGEGYGSFQLQWPGIAAQTVRLRFGNSVTNNEAEYDTLITALETVLKKLGDSQANPTTARIEVFGDSLLVINQTLGRWKVKEERLLARRDKVQALLKRFGRWSLTHHDREHSVRALGH